MRLRALFSFAFALFGLQTSAGAVGKDALDQTGEFYRSVTVNYGEEHVFCVTNLSKSTAVESLSVSAGYSWWEGGTNRTGTLTLTEKTTTYDADNLITGFFALLTAADWESVPQVDETGKLTFSCKVSGHYDSKTANNNKFTFGHGAGRKGYPKELPHGMSEGDPVVLTPSTAPQSTACDGGSRYCKGSYYFSADLSAGHKYLFGIEGDRAYPARMYPKGETSDLFATADVYTNVWTDCRVAYAVVAPSNGTYFIHVACGTNKFALASAAVAFRRPAQHPHGEISTVNPVTFVPGYLNDPESGAFDDVIDQELFAFSNYGKGDCLQFSAASTNLTGATTNLLMRLYNSSGKVLGESRWKGNGETGRVVWAATSAGSSSSPLYVGVCQDLAKDEPTNAVGEVRLDVSRVELRERTSLVTAVPDSADRSPDVCPEVVPTDVRELGQLEWSDVFALPARAGITYRIKAGLVGDGTDNGYRLTATAYTLSGTTKKPLADNLVSDSAAIDPKANGYWTISPNANATVYIEVSVADGDWGSGDGLDYGPYVLHATGKGTGDLGLLKADMGGAADSDMGWKIVSGPAVAGIVSSKEPYYPAGSTVILPVGGVYAVAAKSISGFKNVDSRGYDANVYVTGGGETSRAKEFRYFDTTDPLDDGPDTKAKEPTTNRAYKPTKISPASGAPAEVVRSLWNAYEGESYRDTNDWFTVSANEGTYYRFSLPWTSDENATEVRVYGPDDCTRECAYNVFKDPKDSVRISAEKGTYYIRVANDRPEASTNCAYRLRTLMTTPGTVKLSKNALTVKDTDAYADITVNRTGKDGRIRVKYYTEAVEAQPGKDYYPVSASEPTVLVWENGDNKAKTVRIKLIPDIVTVPIGIAKTFKVRFETYGWDEVDAANEYVPRFDSKMGDTVTVSISETKKQTAGTIQVECGDPKKPVFDIVAGETLEIPFERVLGTNGVVGVVAATAKGTANKSGETDYESATVTNVWENGVGGRGPSVLSIRTKPTPSDFTAKKTFTVKLTALTSKKGDAVQYAKPTLAASTVTVNILNDKYAQTAPDWSKSKDFPSGVTGIREGKGGTWFRADDGVTNLYSTISRKFAGPSRLRWWNADASVYGGQVNELFVPDKGATVMMRTEDAYTNDLLQAVTPAAPTVDKACVAGGTVELRFDRLPDGAERGIGYRVFFGPDADKSKFGKDPGLEVSAPYEVQVAAGEKYAWRVDSFFEGGSVTNTAKSAWALNVLKDAEKAATLKVGGQEVSAAVDLFVGQSVDLSVTTEDDAAAKVAVVSGTGSLPAGIRLEQDRTTKAWSVRGTPTKAGEYRCAIQASYSSPTRKSPTFALEFSVAPLATVTPLAPTVDKAVLTNGPYRLRFEAGGRCRVFFGSDADKSRFGKDPSLEISDPYAVTVESGKKYAWQVFTFAEGGSITNKSAQFSLVGAAEGAGQTAVRGTDAYGTPFAEGTVMRLRQRLYAEFEIADAGAKKVTSIGTLPTGLKLEQDKDTAKSPGSMKWYVRGTPTKAGAFRFLVQATYTNMVQDAGGRWKSVDVPAATAAMDVTVEAVEAMSDISFTLAGPGRFVCDATDVRYPDGERRHTVTNWIKSGSQTLKLSDQEHIYSYSYVQLPAAEPIVPLVDKATVRTGPVEFRFTRGADDARNGIAYRVYALSDGASWTNVTYDSQGRERKTTGKYKLGDAATEIAFDGSYGTNVWYDAKVNRGKWTWRVDSFFVGGTVTNGPKSAWTFTVADESKLPPGAPLAVTPVRGRDAYGNELDITGGHRVVLHRLVRTDLAVGAPGSSVAKVTGTLPAGLSLKSVKGADGLAQNWLVGTPTKAGEYLLVLQETSDKVKGSTTALAITVEDAGRPEGTYNGLASVDADDSVKQYREAVAQVSFSAPSSGKLSAKALIGGKTYTFADTGYARARTNDENRVVLEAVLTQLQKVKQNGVQVTFTNELELAVLEGETDDAALWTRFEPGLRLRMRALPYQQGDGYYSDIDYSGTLVRDNTKVKEWVAAAAGFSGYYTAALVPDTQTGGWTNNVPNGNGYLTMTLDAKGTAKVGGSLADGASFSASLPVALGETNGERTVVLPLYAAKNKSVLAGWTGIRFPGGQTPKEPVTGPWTNDVPVVLSFGDEGVVWFNDDSNATYDGKFGYGIGIHPVGGWYDTVINLQRHYIGGDYDHTFSVDTATVDELWQISDLIHDNVGAGYSLATNALPCGQTVDLAVNSLVVDKQSLVKDSTKTYYVWDECVNPANVTLTFKRATGILTGTCCIWYEGVNAKGAFEQKSYSNCKHAGVFLMCRDADDLLSDDTVTAGALIVPQTIKLPNGSKRTWNANFRFNVRSAKREETDWDD